MLIENNTDPRVSLLQDIVMNNHYIANLHDPNSPQDAATKNYVDSNISNKEVLLLLLLLQASYIARTCQSVNKTNRRRGIVAVSKRRAGSRMS